MKRRLSAARLLIAASIAAGSLTFAGPALADEPVNPGAVPGETTAEVAASREAADTGHSVQVDEATTETSTVVAQPDGTFQLTVSHDPVRIRTGSGWEDIDTNLHTNTDGSVSPNATSIDVTFSGGGAGPLARVESGDANLSFSWPGQLPTPQLDGNSATYEGVMPGVDLVVTAHAASYSEVLVVRDRAAAEQPALTSLQFGIDTQNLAVTPAAGGFTASDDTGAAVFTSSTPQIWDSQEDPSVPNDTPSATDPAEGSLTPVAAQVPATNSVNDDGHTTETLAAPEAAVSGPDVVYPVYIDPGITKVEQAELVVSSGPTKLHLYNDTTNDLKVGRCPTSTSPDCNGIGVARTFLDFSTADLINRPTKPTVYAAEVDLYVIKSSAGCTAEPIALRDISSFSTSTTYTTPVGAQIATTNTSRGGNCDTHAHPEALAGYVALGVQNKVDDAAQANTNHVSFAVVAPDETDENQWHRFASTGAASVPILKVTYLFPPSVPTQLHMDSAVVCPGKPVYTRDTTPVLHAQAHDNGPAGGSLRLYFGVTDDPATRDYRDTVAGGVPTSSDVDTPFSTDGAYANKTTPIPDGPRAFTVQSQILFPDGYGSGLSAYSPWYKFTIDHVRPDTPAISSFDYPEGTWGSSQAAPGTFQVTSAGAAGVTYSITGPGNEPRPSDINCKYQPDVNPAWSTLTNGTGNIQMPTGLEIGYHTIYVRTFDDAHNFSDESQAYTFYVSPTLNAADPKQEGEDLANAHPVTGYPSQDGVYNECGHTFWSQDCQEHLVANGGSTSAPQRFTFHFNAPITADYALGVNLTRAYHFGKVQYEIDNTPIINDVSTDIDGKPAQIGQPLVTNLYHDTVETVFQKLGGQRLASGDHTFTIDVVGQDSRATDYYMHGTYGGVAFDVHDNGFAADLDYLSVVPLSQPTGTRINGARNNIGISDGSTARNFEPSTTNSSLALSELNGIGINYGQGFTADAGTSSSARFVVLTPDTAGNDNVIAAGQTLNFPAPIAAAYVDLLVASTCGMTNPNASANLQLSVIETDPATGQTYNSSTPFPPVPDWHDDNAGPGLTTGVTALPTMSQSYVGTTLTSSPAHLYHVHLPTQEFVPGRVVSGITLPNFGSSFTNACTTPTLHVFSISEK